MATSLHHQVHHGTPSPTCTRCMSMMSLTKPGMSTLSGAEDSSMFVFSLKSRQRKPPINGHFSEIPGLHEAPRLGEASQKASRILPEHEGPFPSSQVLCRAGCPKSNPPLASPLFGRLPFKSRPRNGAGNLGPEHLNRSAEHGTVSTSSSCVWPRGVRKNPLADGSHSRSPANLRVIQWVCFHGIRTQQNK